MILSASRNIEWTALWGVEEDYCYHKREPMRSETENSGSLGGYKETDKIERGNY